MVIFHPYSGDSATSVESELGCTSRVYFNYITLTSHNVTRLHRNHVIAVTSSIATKQTVITLHKMLLMKFSFFQSNIALAIFY